MFVRAVACSGKAVSFPMTRHGAILGLGGSLADQDHIEYVSLSILGLAAFGVAPSATAVRKTT